MKISRRSFIQKNEDRAVDVQKLSRLRGISRSTLGKVRNADLNRDGKVQGRRELDRLFSEMDKFDKDGSRRTIRVSTRRGVTRAGKALQAVQQAMVDADSISDSTSTSSPRTVERSNRGSTSRTPRRGRSGSVRRADLSTAGMSESQKYDFYKDLIQDNGGTFQSKANKRNILSLRTETDADANGGKGRYDDTTVMLWTDRNGRKRVREYTSNTEPSARYRGRLGADVDGDGRKDQGRLPAGYYEYRTERHGKFGNVLRPTSATMAERDTNQDGLFNDGASSSAGRTMLFHKGGNTITGSAGCQTMKPAEYNRFWRDLTAVGNPGTVGYTLINVD